MIEGMLFMNIDRAATAGKSGGAIRAALLTVILILATGCAERYLQTAEDSFSKGAAIENQGVLGDPAGAPDRSALRPVPLTGAVIYYADSRQNVRKALTSERSALDKQGLTGPAFALLAIVSWRLDDLQGSVPGGDGDPCDTRNYRLCAENSSAMAKTLLEDQQFLKRDRFMVAILPGLLDHNRGLRNTESAPLRASNDFKSAFQNIGRGFVVVDPVRPVDGTPLTTEQSLKIYGLLAQYQVLRAWSAAMTRASLPGVPSEQALTDQQRASCKAILRQDWASQVRSNLVAVDPQGLAVPPALRTSFERAIGDIPGNQPCPWPL
jgi:hypothetical protein